MWDLRGQCPKPSQLGLKNRSRAKTTQHIVIKYNDKNVTRTEKTAIYTKCRNYCNQGLITQDKRGTSSKSKEGKENYIAS